MNIKRYVAASMREGLERVRDEQGPDAVIVSSARVDGAIEIIAATDYDAALMSDVAARRPSRHIRPSPPESQSPVAVDAGVSGKVEVRAAEPREPAGFGELLGRLVQDAMRGRRGGARVVAAEIGAAPAAASPDARSTPDQNQTSRTCEKPAVPAVVVGGAPVEAPVPASADSADELEAAAESAPRIEAPRPQVVWSQDPAIVAMRQELAAMRSLLEAQHARLAWDDLVRREPMRARVLRDLSALDIAPDVARVIVTSMPAVANEADASRIALALLMRHIPVATPDPLAAGGVHALVGPTGAGKTTTVAKLAAHAALQYGRDAVGLICTDNDRVGAREQLAALARVLAVPLVAVSTATDLQAAVDGFRGRKLVLIDTAGVTRRNLQLQEESALWTRLRNLAQVHAVLPASADAAVLAELAGSGCGLRAVSAIVTKIDEAASLGPVLSAVVRAGLPICRLCDGPRAPEDLHEAGPRRIWLLKRAVKLQHETRHQADEQRLAEALARTMANG